MTLLPGVHNFSIAKVVIVASPTASISKKEFFLKILKTNSSIV